MVKGYEKTSSPREYNEAILKGVEVNVKSFVTSKNSQRIKAWPQSLLTESIWCVFSLVIVGG